MSYTWTNGELITAAKLNSTGGGDIVVTVWESEALDMTWQEIFDAMNVDNKLVIIKVAQDVNDIEFLIVTALYVDGGSYYVVTTNLTLVASSANGYPVED